MKVFVAGATGVVGRRAVVHLVAAGHEVHGMTRSESKQAMLHELGAVPAGDFHPGVDIRGVFHRRRHDPVVAIPLLGGVVARVGAAAGMVVGGGLVLAALVVNTISGLTGNWAPSVFGQPALITVPVAFLTVILVSKATQNKLPADVAQIRLRMHAPDNLGFIRDRAVASFGTAEERARLADGRHRK